MLQWDESVSAFLGRKDEKFLRSSQERALPDRSDLEKQVAASVQSAWRYFRMGAAAAALRAMGQVPDADVYIVPPARSKAVRWRNGFVLSLGTIGLVLWTLVLIHPPWMDGLRPVNVTEAQVRAFLNATAPKLDRTKFAFNSPSMALFTCLVLPSTNLFSPKGLRAMRNEVVAGNWFDLMGKAFESLKQSPGRAQAVFRSPLMRRAATDGWISWSDLGIRPADAAASLRSIDWAPMYSPDKLDQFLIRCQSWSWVKEEKFDVMRIQLDGVTQLRLLQAVNCLDLINREKLIRQIASVQTLSGTPPGQPPIHDWRDVSGLFFTPCFPALQDTYYSLAALEILGGLDKIDREACIEGILSRHRGKGWFTSPNSGGFNEYHIDGSARDTIAAYESLRILGALDRVKDLAQWQFRPQRRGVAKGQLIWQDVEAWVCQQRLEKILRQRKENPQTPAGSLLSETTEFNRR